MNIDPNNLYPQLQERLKVAGNYTMFNPPASAKAINKDPKIALPPQLSASSTNVDFGTISLKKFSALCIFLLPGMGFSGSIRYLHIEIDGLGGKKIHDEDISRIRKAFTIDRRISHLTGLTYTNELAALDPKRKIFALISHIRGCAERNRLHNQRSHCLLVRHRVHTDYKALFEKNRGFEYEVRSLELQSVEDDTLPEGLQNQNQDFFSVLSEHSEHITSLRALSINGTFPYVVHFADQLSQLILATGERLTHVNITSAGIEDAKCHTLVMALRRKPTLRVIDLSDNEIQCTKKSSLEFLVETADKLELLILSRNLFQPKDVDTIRTKAGENEDNPNLQIVMDLLSDYSDRDQAIALRGEALPEEATAVYRLIPKEYTQRRLGDKWEKLWSLLSEPGKVEISRSMLVAGNGDIEQWRNVEKELQQTAQMAYEKIQEFYRREELARKYMDDVLREAKALLQEVQGIAVNIEKLLEDMKSSDAFSDEDRTLMEEWRALRDSAQTSSVQDQLTKIEENMSDLAGEVLALKEMQNLYAARGRFLEEHPNLQIAYGAIVQALKAEMMGREALASGYFKKEAFQDSLKWQGISRKLLGGPLKVVNFGGTKGVSALSQVLGTVCGVLSISLSGVTMGASLALDVIPLALGILTPVLTTAIDTGCMLLGKSEGWVLDRIFDRIDEHRAKKRLIAIAQVGSLTFQDQLNMDLAFGFVFHYQKQLELLTNKGAKDFANAWVKGLTAFAEKNKGNIEQLMGNNLLSGPSFVGTFQDLSWDDIPNTILESLNHRGKVAWDWLVDETQKEGFQNHFYGQITSQQLLRDTGVRWKENNRWVFYSSDHNNVTHAWRFGYRTLSSAEAGLKYIHSHQRGYLAGSETTINLVTQAVFSFTGSKRSRLEEYTKHVMDVEMFDRLHKKDNLAEKLVFAVSPAIDRISGGSLDSFFNDKARTRDAKLSKYTAQFLKRLLEQDGDTFHQSPDNLRLLVRELVEEDPPSSCSVELIIQGVMDEILTAKYDLKVLSARQKSLCRWAKWSSKSPMNELLAVMKKYKRQKGCLFVPVTNHTKEDWHIIRIDIEIMNKSKKAIVKGLYHQGMGADGNLSTVCNEVREILEQIFGNSIDISPQEVVVQFTGNINLPDGQQFSTANLVAEYIRRFILRRKDKPVYSDEKELRTAHKEHQRLIRALSCENSESFDAADVLEYSERDLLWQNDPQALGPPFPFED